MQRPDSSTEIRESQAARFAVAILFLVNMVSYTDRSILTLVVGPVKQALHLSDGQIGLMQGPAFVLTFVTAGLMFGFLVDRINRRTLLLCCIAFWSVSAAACGFVQNGTQLFIARMGVGVGEAAMIPTAISLIADYFVPDRRGAAWGLVTMGVYVGTGLSLVLIGLALPSLGHLSAWLASSYGWSAEPWRIIMISLLVPGAICCALLGLVREPERAARSDSLPSPSRDGHAWPGDWQVLLSHHLFSAFAAMALYALNAWFPTALIREHGLSASQSGVAFGVTVAIVGVCSAALGGRLADIAMRKTGTRGRAILAMTLAFIGMAGFIPVATHLGLVPVFAAIIVIISSLSMAQVVTVAIVSDLSNSRNRGIISSGYFVFAGVIGTAGGPATVGYVSDHLGAQSGGLSAAVAIVGGGAALASLVFGAVFLVALRRKKGSGLDVGASWEMSTGPVV